MRVINKIECGSSYRKDGNTEYTPVIKIIAESTLGYTGKNNVTIQIDKGKKVEIRGLDLIKAVNNALNV